MIQLRHILAATDLSNASAQALDRGFLIAGSAGARYTILYALGLDDLAPLRVLLGERAGDVSRKISEDARERLMELISDSGPARDVKAELRLEHGIPAVAIPAFAEANGIDLLLLGAHGSGFLQRMALGSTTSRLLRRSKCPVLVVKQEAHRKYRRALVAVDFSPGSENTIRVARAVAPDADIVLLHVFDVPFAGKMQFAGVGEDLIRQHRVEARERATRQLHELARSAGLAGTDYSGLVDHGDATRQIVEHEENGRCDLVVMGKHGTHVTEDLLLGSATKRVLAQSRSDVLVVVDARLPDQSEGRR